MRIWVRRTFVTEPDAWAGKFEADVIRNGIVCSALFDELWQDDSLQALVSHWADTTGLRECAEQLASATDRLAELMGLQRRGQLGHYEEGLTESELKLLEVETDRVYQIFAQWKPTKEDFADEDLPEFIRRFAEWKVANESFITQLSTTLDTMYDSIQGEAKNFVIDLGLPYPGLVYDLFQHFYHGIIGFTQGKVYFLERSLVPQPFSEIDATMTTMYFQTEEGESVEQAQRRLKDQFQETMGNLTRSLPKREKFPDHTIQPLVRDARWFYRHKVKGESIRSLAISEFGSSDRRKDVYDGIKRAADLLSLNKYTD
jgi:hypothetical protein